LKLDHIYLRAAHSALLLLALSCISPASAKDGAHVHGLVNIDVTIDAKKLIVQLEAPLDSMLSFEHRPRTAAQKQAAQALIKQLNDVSTLIRPQSEAQCKSIGVMVKADALQPKPNGDTKEKNTKGKDPKDEEHSDLEASYEFSCEQPDKLTSIEFGLFDAFKRVQKIQAQVAGPKGQSKQLLKRPVRLLRVR
jgi:Protein of unknown function (DUF2796)